jgi:predicted aspartyl protease
MKEKTLFNPNADLIIIQAEIWGPTGTSQARLALDTGATHSILIPELMDEIGYSARDGIQRAGVRSVIGREEGYLLELKTLSALGFSFANQVVMVLDLPDGDGIDGLLGLEFLKQLNLELRIQEGTIWAELAT